MKAERSGEYGNVVPIDKERFAKLSPDERVQIPAGYRAPVDPLLTTRERMARDERMRSHWSYRLGQWFTWKLRHFNPHINR